MLDLFISKDLWKRLEFLDKGAGHEQVKSQHLLRAQSLENRTFALLTGCFCLWQEVSDTCKKMQKMQLKSLCTNFTINPQLG